MKKVFYLPLFIAIALSSCNNSFKKEKDGILYKIISDGKGKKLEVGKFFEIQFQQTYKDSKIDTILADSKKIGSQFAQMDSNAIPPVYFRIFKQTRAGDSIIIKQPTDSIIKMSGGNIPPFIKKGQFIIAHYKIVNIFDTKEQVEAAVKANAEKMRIKDSVNSIAQLSKDDKAIADYIAKNKITAVKAPKGTYVEIVTPGTGANLDTSKVAKVLYTGKTLSGGKVFDSNTDPKFGHPQAFPVSMNVAPGAPGSVIAGWTDGLSLLNKGAKARFYIPSSLAYGAHGAGGEIKPDENLVFDIEVVDVITKEQAKAEEAVERAKAQAQQKHMMDSVRNAQKKDSAAKK
jgi:FKBP-type peptidyl-prolyl cis-trans isomerase FkpA